VVRNEKDKYAPKMSLTAKLSKLRVSHQLPNLDLDDPQVKRDDDIVIL
jgi:hypothetical protein